jgi:hypothetical protein
MLWTPPPPPAPTTSSALWFTPEPEPPPPADLIPSGPARPWPPLAGLQDPDPEAEPVNAPWAALPPTQAGWPPPAEPAPAAPAPSLLAADPPPAPEPGPRRFGKPADDAAHAEMLEAARLEQLAKNGFAGPEAEPEPAPKEADFPPLPVNDAASSLPSFLTANRDDDTLLSAKPAQAVPDRFAELVYAARNKSVEYEPETPAKKARGPSRPAISLPVRIVLVLVLVIALVLLKHHLIAQHIPFMGKLFWRIGLK